MRQRISLVLLFLLGLLVTACSGSSGASSTGASSTPSKFDAQAAFASYVGKWEVHGVLLTINADHTGLEVGNVGPCGQQSTGSQLCNSNATITFAVNPDGSIKGTIQSVKYTQGSGTPAPAGFQTTPENLQAGDTFNLQHVNAHLLYTTWLGARQSILNNNGNRYFCDSSTSQVDRPKCGA